MPSVPPAEIAQKIAPNPNIPFVPALRVRPEVQQSNIAGLSAAYAAMQGLSESDRRSWIYWAEFHGFNRFDCWHHGTQGQQHYPYDLFLPWHRAYLQYFELVAFASNPGVALPWWDWTSVLSHEVGVPPAFEHEPPLASGPVPPSLRTDPPRTTRSPGHPSELPSTQTIDAILEISSFEEFSRELQNQHDFVHGWTGGDMGVVATSAFDPIFWSHHAMIDRLWYLWQLRHGVDNIPPNYLNLVLAPWSLTVQDVLSVTALGYTYGAARLLIPIDKFKTAPLLRV
jgi:tyrosinase